MLFANSDLVWVRADGVAALSVAFQSVVRAGDGVAIALSEGGPMLASRVERWVAGQQVAVVRPAWRAVRATQLLSADADGFELFVEESYACMPGSGGLANHVDRFLWSSPQPVGSREVACSEEALDALSDEGGNAVPSLAAAAPDGTVLVPGADRVGVFIVRVRTTPAP